MKNSEAEQLTISQLKRPIGGQIHFNDVFLEHAQLDEKCWWRKTDFDAGITVFMESSPAGVPKILQIPVGLRPWQTSYGIVLADELLSAKQERVKNSQYSHPDLETEKQSLKNAFVVVANKAPRSNKHVADGKNGSDFYLAITFSGMEIYTTPTDFLSELESRNKIRALYRIPTADHPEFHESEQFRSSRVVRSRRHFSHLVKIYDYSTEKELLQAKSNNSYPEEITLDNRLSKIVHIDKFGNTVLEMKSPCLVDTSRIGDILTLSIKTPNGTFKTKVEVSKDLKSSSVNKLSVYKNCSSGHNSDEGSSHIELMVRVDDDPNTSEKTAFFQLQEIAGMIDPENTIFEFEK